MIALAPPAPIERPPPPRPATCPHCGFRDPVAPVQDAFDGTWSWACTPCGGEVVPAVPLPRRPLVDEWDEDSGIVTEAKPVRLRRVTRAQERQIIALAKRDVPTAKIAARIGVVPWTVNKIRARHKVPPAPRRPGSTLGAVGSAARVRCAGCGRWFPFEVRNGRRVLLDAEIVDARTRARRPHTCGGRP